MTAVSGKGPFPGVISREQGAKLFDKVDKIKEEIYKIYQTRALQSSRSMSEDELSALVKEGYEEFAHRVHQEYDHTSCADYAQMLIGSYKTGFYSDEGLYGKISKVVLLK